MQLTPHMLATWEIDLENFSIEAINQAAITIGLSPKTWVDVSDLYHECCRIENIEPPYSAYGNGGNARLNHSEVARIAARSGLRINSPSTKLLKAEKNEQAKLEGPVELTDEQKTQLAEFSNQNHAEPKQKKLTKFSSQAEFDAEKQRHMDRLRQAIERGQFQDKKAGA